MKIVITGNKSFDHGFSLRCERINKLVLGHFNRNSLLASLSTGIWTLAEQPIHGIQIVLRWRDV